MRALVLLIAVVLLPAMARADDSSNPAPTAGISVIGAATVQVRPSTVEISATLSAEAEMANDARVKERDNRQRFIDAMAAKWPSITVESKGISINPVLDANALAMQRQQQLIMVNGNLINAQNQADFNRRIGVSEQMRLVLKDADKLETSKLIETVTGLIDTLREQSLQLGPPAPNSPGIASLASSAAAGPLVICKANAAARGQAYKAALDDARQKASLLADLAGEKIGKVVGIRELDATSETPPPGLHSDAELSSTLIADLSIRVRLAVQFEIVK